MIVWIVGNGPSLKQTPPERIPKPHASFATNLIAKRFVNHPWRPTFFVAVSEAARIAEYQHLFEAGVAGARHGAYIADENWELLGDNHDRHTDIRTYDDNPGWTRLNSDDGRLEFNRWGMSHMVSFQLAAYMLTRAVYLIGFDGNFGPYELGEDHNHFDESYWGKYQKSRPKDTAFWDRMNRDHAIAHSIVKVKYKKADIPIYNCTPNSAFTMHEYMPFEEAISG
jgi:hypothetical protein